MLESFWFKYPTIFQLQQDKNKNKMTCTPSEDADQFGHPPSVIRVFAVRGRRLGSLVTHWVHSEDWSDWADAQADLSLRWAQTSFRWFSHDVAQFLSYILFFCDCFTTEVKFITTKDIPIRTIKIYRGSYMSGHLIWSLWNSLCNFGILRALASKIPKLHNEFHKFHVKWPLM